MCMEDILILQEYGIEVRSQRFDLLWEVNSLILFYFHLCFSFKNFVFLFSSTSIFGLLFQKHLCFGFDGFTSML
jgi:hypothetical protein